MNITEIEFLDLSTLHVFYNPNSDTLFTGTIYSSEIEVSLEALKVTVEIKDPVINKTYLVQAPDFEALEYLSPL